MYDIYSSALKFGYSAADGVKDSMPESKKTTESYKTTSEECKYPQKS